MKQFTEEQAIKIAKSGVCEDWTDQEIVKFQLYQKRLCMDFAHFHIALERVLGRPVFTHEMASSNIGNIRDEYTKTVPAPTFGEIVGLLSKIRDDVILIEVSKMLKEELQNGKDHDCGHSSSG